MIVCFTLKWQGHCLQLNFTAFVKQNNFERTSENSQWREASSLQYLWAEFSSWKLLQV